MNSADVQFTTGANAMTLDDIDRKILSELVRDCRRSSRALAKKAGTSVGTVLTRIRKLEKEGIIKGYAAILDQEKLGYQLTVIAEITMSKGKLLQIEETIGKLPNICAVYDITGSTDAIAIAKFRNREELSKFTKSLLAMPFVERSNTHVVLTTVKEDFRLPSGITSEREYSRVSH
jgi:DNA-binding Lrp family transcriptional regulator